MSRNTIISVSHPPRQLLTWEYHRRNRTILLYFTRCQQQVLECFWKSNQKSTLITGFWTHNKCGMSRGSKPVHIGDLHMGLISCLQQLAQEVQKAEGSQPLKDMVPAQYHNFRDVFSKEAFDELPPWKASDHSIDLTPGTELPCSWMFPLSPAEQKELDDFLQENIANGHICPSKSPMRAPVFFIKKKDSSLHLIQDYQKLNKIMVKNSYPLPLVSDVLTHLCNTEFFTILD